MKSTHKQIKMADLQFVDFALMLGPVRNEKQFELPGDFCKIGVTIPSWMSHTTSGFPAVFHNKDGLLFSGLQNVSHNKVEAKNHEKFHHFRS